ncbi:CopG family ribbon-helix-helix protein [Neorhizobium petrolearium]|uniref:CopG family ribbon-helix-helix protein n=1 Tax=Neorhizobium petrolearium TaxID=515361 RepID=UPI003F17237E
MATSLKINDDLEDRVQKLAVSRRQSTQGLMREAIEQYVEREEARENFKQEALASWEDYKDTGLHLTGDELRAWMKTWGTEAETEAPECHK